MERLSVHILTYSDQVLVRLRREQDLLKEEDHQPWYLRHFPDVAPKGEGSDLPLLDVMREGDLSSLAVTTLPDGRTFRDVTTLPDVRIGIEHRPSA